MNRENSRERNAIGVRKTVDDVHEDRTSNLICYHNGRFWDITEIFDFQRTCCSSMVGLPG